MSKNYVIDIPDDAQHILINGASENHCYTRVEQVDDLEELNSDYINEHYGELQDEAYKRGLEDGKWKAEDGCDGCKYYEDASLTNPCSECSRGCVDHYKPVSDHDRIEVGDEVSTETGKKYTVVSFGAGGTVCGFNMDGKWTWWKPKEVTKTGKHYDIASILEAMRE